MPVVMFKIDKLDLELLKEIYKEKYVEEEIRVDGRKEKILKFKEFDKRDFFAFFGIIGLYKTKVRM